jgi:hypothetical protein
LASQYFVIKYIFMGIEQGRSGERRPLPPTELGQQAYGEIERLRRGLNALPEVQQVQQLAEVPSDLDQYSVALRETSYYVRTIEETGRGSETPSVAALRIDRESADGGFDTVDLRSEFVSGQPSASVSSVPLEKTFLDGHVIVEEVTGVRNENTPAAVARIPQVFPEFYQIEE